RQTLDALRAQGRRLGIVSNTGWRTPWGDRELARVGIRDSFPVRLYSADIQIEKPDPRIFQAALAALNIADPATALYIGDHLGADVAGAQGAGLRPAWFAPAGTTAPPPAAPAQPDLIVTALRELPAALAGLAG